MREPGSLPYDLSEEYEAFLFGDDNQVEEDDLDLLVEMDLELLLAGSGDSSESSESEGDDLEEMIREVLLEDTSDSEDEYVDFPEPQDDDDRPPGEQYFMPWPEPEEDGVIHIPWHPQQVVPDLGAGGDWDAGGGWETPDLYLPLPNEYFDDSDDWDEFLQAHPEPSVDSLPITEPVTIPWGPFLISVPPPVYNSYRAFRQFISNPTLHYVLFCIISMIVVLAASRICYNGRQLCSRVSKAAIKYETTLRNHEYLELQINNLTQFLPEYERILKEKIDEAQAEIEEMQTAAGFGPNLLTKFVRRVKRFLLRNVWSWNVLIPAQENQG